jgi:hypothetical protein
VTSPEEAADLDSFVRKLLRAEDRPCTRSYLQAELKNRLRIDANAANDVLGRVTSADEERVYFYTFEVPKQAHPTLIYSHRDILPAERESLREEIAAQFKLVASLLDQGIGKVAEKYVRALLRRAQTQSKLYGWVTPASKAGRDKRLGVKFDLAARFSYAGSEISLGIEVKNRGETFYSRGNSTATILGKLLEGAITAKAQPVLICAHMAAEFEDFCRLAGIATLNLDRQLLPRKSKKHAADLRKIRGDLGYEFIDPKRPIRDERLGESIQADLGRVMEPAWILDAHGRWCECADMAVEFALEAYRARLLKA